jgi:hypothetical protein
MARMRRSRVALWPLRAHKANDASRLCLNARLAKLSEHAAPAMHVRSRTTRFSLWAALVVCLLWPLSAHSRPGATLVALVSTDPSAELSQRVQEQLAALGFDVLVLNPPVTGAVGSTALEQTARNVGAIAAVRIVPAAQSVQVWTADPVTGQSVFRETVPPAGQKPSDAAVALGAVELLRASLIELHPPEPVAAPKPPEPPVVCTPLAPPAARAEPRISVTAGFGMDLGLAGRPGVSWEMAIWVRLYDRLGVRAIAIPGLAPGGFTASPYGSVDVASQVYGAELTYDLAPSLSAIVPVAGLGIARAEVTVRGFAAASSGNGNLDGDKRVALPFGHLGVGWAPVRNLRVRADALGGFSDPAVQACLQDSQGNCMSAVARWGEPFVNASLGLELLGP